MNKRQAAEAQIFNSHGQENYRGDQSHSERSYGGGQHEERKTRSEWAENEISNKNTGAKQASG